MTNNPWTVSDGLADINITKDLQDILCTEWISTEYGVNETFENRVRIMAIGIALNIYNKEVPNLGQAISNNVTLTKLLRSIKASKKLSIKFMICKIANLEGPILYPLLQCLIHIKNAQHLEYCIEGMIILCDASVKYNSPVNIAKRSTEEKKKLKELEPSLQLKICEFIGTKGLHWYKTLLKLHKKLNVVLSVNTKRRKVKDYSTNSHDLLLIYHFLKTSPELKDISDVVIYTSIPGMLTDIIAKDSIEAKGIRKALTDESAFNNVFKFGSVLLQK